MSGKDSYLTAYDTNGSKEQAYVESSKLLLRKDIQDKILTLRKPQETAAQIEGFNARKEQIREIQERIAICKQKDDESSLIRYYDMLNKIYALYKDSDTDKLDDHKLSKIDTKALQKLVNG